MHPIYIPQCTIQNRNVYISVLTDVLWDIDQVHCGVCEIGQQGNASFVSNCKYK